MGSLELHDDRYFDPDSGVRRIAHEILLVARHLRNPATGLYYPAWDEPKEQFWADSLMGLSKNFWGRGMGWYGMALVDVLDYLPEDYPARGAIVRVLQRYAEAVRAIQDPVTGLWYQVLDKPNREENYLEASSSNMFTYMFVKGVREGYLDAEYLDVVRRVYDGILEHFIEVDDDGLVNLDHTASVGSLGGDDQHDGTFEYYMSEPIRLNYHKGVGPFIMASLLMEALDEDRSASRTGN